MIPMRGSAKTTYRKSKPHSVHPGLSAQDQEQPSHACTFPCHASRFGCTLCILSAQARKIIPVWNGQIRVFGP